MKDKLNMRKYSFHFLKNKEGQGKSTQTKESVFGYVSFKKHAIMKMLVTELKGSPGASMNSLWKNDIR